MTLGSYLRELRNRHGFTLKDVEKEIHISISYISQIEKDIKEKPQRQILKKFAELYNVKEYDLMVLAGHVKTDKYPHSIEEQEVNRAFEFARTDPNFKFGQNITVELDVDVKKFIIELYEEATGKRLLGGKIIN